MKSTKFEVRNRNSRRRVYVKMADAPESAKTQQQFRDECDINKIVEKARRGITPRYLARGIPKFGDFSEVPDMVTALNKINAAKQAFMQLPAKLRLELGNDPANIDQLTQEQARRYKLLKAQPEPEVSTPPSQPLQPKASKAGQAAPAGTEPAETERKART